MHRLALLLAIVLVVPLLGFDSPKEYDDRTTADPLEGTWRLTEFAYNGVIFASSDHSVMTCRAGTYVEKFSDGRTNRGSYRIDAAHMPPHLDWLPSSGADQGLTIKSIFNIDGDTLMDAHICGENEVERPRKFNGDGVAFCIYKRVK